MGYGTIKNDTYFTELVHFKYVVCTKPVVPNLFYSMAPEQYTVI